jgi:hypothetical protein
MYTGPVDGVWTAPVQRAANTWQRTYGMPVRPFWARNDWIAMLSRGGTPVLKIGSAGDPARRLQRALNASGHRLALDAVVNPNDSGAVRAYQRELGLPATGVAYRETWLALMRGRY